MTDNQNMNKTSMRHVQQRSLFKTSGRVNKMFPKTFFLSKQDFRKLSLIFTGSR